MSKAQAQPFAFPPEFASGEFPLGIAYSGGADSTALLWRAAQLWPEQIVALHVHHGLQAAADDFVLHAQSFCAQLGVPLHIARVQAKHASGESPEDAARKARYVALAELAQQHGLHRVALAQHADDQVETLLLALSRGAGLPGLAGMAAQFERHGMVFERPFLHLSADGIRQTLRALEVPFIEDPTNRDIAYTRNRIRHVLLPALAQAFPTYRSTFARSARHAAQAQALLEEVSFSDLQTVGVPPNIRALQQLSPIRLGHVLRHWLKTHYQTTPSSAQLEELCRQVQACVTRGHRIAIRVGSGWVERVGENLDYRAGV